MNENDIQKVGIASLDFQDDRLRDSLLERSFEVVVYKGIIPRQGLTKYQGIELDLI